MVLSKREKFVAIALGGALAVLVLDRLVYTPLNDWGDQLTTDQAELQQNKDQQQTLFQREHNLRKVWAELNSGGLKSDASEAEAQIERAVSQWAQESGVAVTSWHPEPRTAKNGFLQINFLATGTGTLAGASKLMYRIETAKIPIRLEDVQLASRKEGNDDLTITLKLSTLSTAPAGKGPRGTARVRTAAAADTSGDRS